MQIDGFFLHSFEVWLACTVVFPGLGNLGFTLLEYRLGHRSLVSSLAENLKWVPFLCVLSTLLRISSFQRDPYQLFLLWRSEHPPIPSTPRPPVLVQHHMGCHQEGSRAFPLFPRSAQDMATFPSGAHVVRPDGRYDDRVEYERECRPCWVAG